MQTVVVLYVKFVALTSCCFAVYYRFLIKKLRGFSPPANYTDRATTACRRS
jgi:hypothetical protein